MHCGVRESGECVGGAQSGQMICGLGFEGIGQGVVGGASCASCTMYDISHGGMTWGMGGGFGVWWCWSLIGVEFGGGWWGGFSG